MGQKLDFNIEDAGLKIDGAAAIGSDASYSGTLDSNKITGGTISADRLPYTITQTAPTNTSGTSSGHIWFVYSS